MKFKDLYKLYESEIFFQHPDEDEEKAREKFYSIQQFENWFKENESNLIWNEQAQGYDCNTDVNIYDLNLFFLPIQFNIVKGNFSCFNNNLTSLEGCPKKIGGNFDCYKNKLKSLKGCPKIIKKHFNCSDNELISLEWSPEEVGKIFDCSYNNLTSLKNCPKIVKEDFYCNNNKLTSLEGYPEEVRGIFDCLHNYLNVNEFIKINCKSFFCDDSYKQSQTYKYWNLKNKLKKL